MVEEGTKGILEVIINVYYSTRKWHLLVIHGVIDF